MRFAACNIGLTVLLVLLIGHASVAVHAASHESADTSECDLCITYSDSSEALDAHHEYRVRPVLDTQDFLSVTDWHAPGPATSVRQRGPPSIL
jgi:hypothetical protein